MSRLEAQLLAQGSHHVLRFWSHTLHLLTELPLGWLCPQVGFLHGSCVVTRISISTLSSQQCQRRETLPKSPVVKSHWPSWAVDPFQIQFQIVPGNKTS